MKWRILPVFSFVLSFSVLSSAATIHVPADYNNIQAAIGAAHTGDTVLVADGIYTGDGNRDIFINRDITVRSENGPDGCIIDCNGTEADLHQAFVISSNATIAGFTIINGYAEEGGAILGRGRKIEIINCVLRNNSARMRGGAVFCMDSNPVIINCIINYNYSVESGGGIFCEYADMSIQNTAINNNSSAGHAGSSWGGGIGCGKYSNITLLNCTISGNMANGDSEGHGGGISCEYSSITLLNCTISSNIAYGDSKGRGGGICCLERSILTINDSEIKDNIARSNDFAFGGGILCSYQTNLTLNDSIVAGNICEGRSCFGGGIYYGDRPLVYGSKCTITGCTIEGNIAEPIFPPVGEGGGIWLRSAQSHISKCLIRKNSAYDGAGIAVEESDSLIWGSVISGNFPSVMKVHESSGIQCVRSNTSISNCTIVGNSLFGLSCKRGSTNVTNSILYYNGIGGEVFDQIEGDSIIVTYSDIQKYRPQPWPGEGNINADPCFVESGYWDANGTPNRWEDDFWVEGNYRLLSTSPCIDTGKYSSYQLDNSDLDDNPRISGGVIDMGAYEFMPPLEADLKITPRKLNTKSRGNFLTAVLTLPPGINASEISGEPLTLSPGEIPSLKWHCSDSKITATFDRSEVIAALPDANIATIEVSGRLTSGQYFYGTDTIRIIK